MGEISFFLTLLEASVPGTQVWRQSKSNLSQRWFIRREEDGDKGPLDGVTCWDTADPHVVPRAGGTLRNARTLRPQALIRPLVPALSRWAAASGPSLRLPCSQQPCPGSGLS